jgi:alanyl-tRNA synthetase
LFIQDAFVLWDTYGYPIDLTEVSFISVPPFSQQNE